jgi:hypothetical protein
MNSYFRPKAWSLAERYTDLTKSLFLALFYSAVLPSGLLIAAVGFMVHFWADKYCLLRAWAQPPQYSTVILFYCL